MLITEKKLRRLIRNILKEVDLKAKQKMIQTQILNAVSQVRRQNSSWYEENWKWGTDPNLYKIYNSSLSSPRYHSTTGFESDGRYYEDKSEYDKHFLLFSDAVKIIDRVKAIYERYLSSHIDFDESTLSRAVKDSREFDYFFTGYVINLLFNEGNFDYTPSSSSSSLLGAYGYKDFDSYRWSFMVPRYTESGHKDFDFQSLRRSVISLERRVDNINSGKGFLKTYYEFKEDVSSNKDTPCVFLRPAKSVDKYYSLSELVDAILQKHEEVSQGTDLYKQVQYDNIDKLHNDPTSIYSEFENKTVAREFIEDTSKDYIGEKAVNHLADEIKDEQKARETNNDKNTNYYGFDSKDFKSINDLAYRIQLVRLFRYLNSFGMDEGFYKEEEDYFDIEGNKIED